MKYLIKADNVFDFNFVVKNCDPILDLQWEKDLYQ